MTLESDANFKKNWLVVWKIKWGIWQIFIRALKSLKIGTFMRFFSPKLKMYELKIYRGVMCHNQEEWCKSWRGIDLSVQNWHEEFDKFWSEHSKILKTLHFNGLFLIKVYNIWAKKVQRSFVWWHWILMRNLKENWLVLLKMTWRI